MSGLDFSLLAEDGKARRGRIDTAHGPFDTPAFMPVGTLGTVKGLTPGQVAASGAQILLGNTYHLMLRPGAERVARLGGLHKFMAWPKPILTDSGGYQVMSLSELRQIDEEGVTFRSHIDGAKHRLTPERAIEIQDLLDANITMQLDECVKLPAELPVVIGAMERSLRWAERCQRAFRQRPGYGLFAIVQGGVDPIQRRRSAETLVASKFDGYAIGGLAVGEPQESMFQTLDATVPFLPKDRPRYLMGVGRPDDIVGAVLRGIDMFDCVLPTRSGRTGQVFTRRGALNIRNARHLDDPRPLDEACGCLACKEMSRAYLHHLFRAEEMLGPILLTLHNLTYYQDLMCGLRDAIVARSLETFASTFAQSQARGDIAPLT